MRLDEELRLETIRETLDKLEEDLDNECLECVEYRTNVISGALFELQYNLEERLDAE